MNRIAQATSRSSRLQATITGLVKQVGFQGNLQIVPVHQEVPSALYGSSLIVGATNVPDVLEVPYTPEIIGAGQPGEKAHTYILGGKTCMTGDVIGTYSFDQPLKPGDRLIFTDMMQYSFVKNTTFNGTPLPDIAMLNEDGSYRVVQSYGYQQFRERLG